MNVSKVNFRKLPVYDDVLEALQLLRDTDMKFISVTNSSYEMVKEQMTHSDLIDFFDSYDSVESVQNISHLTLSITT